MGGGGSCINHWKIICDLSILSLGWFSHWMTCQTMDTKMGYAEEQIPVINFPVV